jgi:hypothetical protein
MNVPPLETLAHIATILSPFVPLVIWLARSWLDSRERRQKGAPSNESSEDEF